MGWSRALILWLVDLWQVEGQPKTSPLLTPVFQNLAFLILKWFCLATCSPNCFEETLEMMEI